MYSKNYSHNSSGYSSNSFTPRRIQEIWSNDQFRLEEPVGIRETSTSCDSVKCLPPSIDAVMEEFKRNGFDSHYEPDAEINIYNNSALKGMGPSSIYLRQKSWPAPEATPSVPLTNSRDYRSTMFQAVNDIEANVAETLHALPGMLTEQQLQVLSTLPTSIIDVLLKELDQYWVRQRDRPVRYDEMQFCRFCKNNGERESYYRSHRLRWQGRVLCPVLRAYRCQRCGACGDSAHTLKYCPLATAEERTKSAAMMRSVRMASGRRRNAPTPSNDIARDYVVFGEVTPSALTDGAVHNNYEPLDPMWEALARKLLQ